MPFRAAAPHGHYYPHPANAAWGYLDWQADPFAPAYRVGDESDDTPLVMQGGFDGGGAISQAVDTIDTLFPNDPSPMPAPAPPPTVHPSSAAPQHVLVAPPITPATAPSHKMSTNTMLLLAAAGVGGFLVLKKMKKI